MSNLNQLSRAVSLIATGAVVSALAACGGSDDSEGAEGVVLGRVKAWNEDPKPFVWTKTAEQILESLARLLQRTTGAGH